MKPTTRENSREAPSRSAESQKYRKKNRKPKSDRGSQRTTDFLIGPLDAEVWKHEIADKEQAYGEVDTDVIPKQPADDIPDGKRSTDDVEHADYCYGTRSHMPFTER